MLIGVLLFAQFTIAAYACPGLKSSAPRDEIHSAVSQHNRTVAGDDAPAAGVDSASDGMVDCDQMVAQLDPSSPNLCAEHCRQGQQSDQASSLTVPTALLSALYSIASVPEAAPPPRPSATGLSALVAASPPHAILHCVFRT